VSVALITQHAKRSHLWPAWLYDIFPHYLITGTMSLEKLLNIKCVFWFSLQLLLETFLIFKKKLARYDR